MTAMSMDIRNMISPNETLIWNGRPDKKCFILESIFNPMLFFSLVWAAFDIFALSAMIRSYLPDPEADVASPDTAVFLPVLLFFCFHLMPVWMYLGGIIAAVIGHKNTRYSFTDQAVYIVKGGFTENMTRIAYDQIEYIDYHRGVFDKILGVGDVVFHPYRPYISYRRNKKRVLPAFADIADFEEVYRSVVAQMQQSKFDDRDQHTDSSSKVQTYTHAYKYVDDFDKSW